ncbi:hypothetical protein BGX27_007959 [Mortierella sp. AM989]|nr:hypothetical protein BGX27_007959 [Mortierella sp. AM989]
MMNKSAFTTLLFIVALVALSATSVTAQSSSTTTAEASKTSSSTTSTTTAASQPTGNVTMPVPNFSGLATVISNFASGRAANPGNAPTDAASGKSAAGGALLSEQSRGTVMIGLIMVFTTTLLAAIGTVSF